MSTSSDKSAVSPKIISSTTSNFKEKWKINFETKKGFEIL